MTTTLIIAILTIIIMLLSILFLPKIKIGKISLDSYWIVALIGAIFLFAFQRLTFKEFFDRRARPRKDGLYPTVTVRQIMWALKMKPIPKGRWETVFDRNDI